MSGWLLVVAMVAAVNPFRSRVGLREAIPLPGLVVGAAVGIGGVALLAAVAASLLDALQITPETFLIAAGLVAIIAGARTIFFPRPRVEPVLSGWREGLWPIAYPRILSPEVMALSLGLVSQRGLAPLVAAASGGVVALALLTRIPLNERTTRLLTALGTALAMLFVVVGVWMMIEGIRDV
jgi:small neutral amino acid transporter SnatA (MarC family)